MDGYFRQPSKYTKLRIQGLFRLFVKKSQKSIQDFIDSIEELIRLAVFSCIILQPYPIFYPIPVARSLSAGKLPKGWADTYKNSTNQKSPAPSASVLFPRKQPKREKASDILTAQSSRFQDIAEHFRRTSSRSADLKRTRSQR